MEELKDEVSRAVEVLKRGGLILYPTDTVWGIGCDAANTSAVEKIYKLKNSTDKKSMLIIVSDEDMASRYVGKVPDVAWQLFELSEDPLTLILPNGCGVAENLIPEEGTLGIRIPRHEFCHSLLRRFGRAIVSTSANFCGEKTPSNFLEIDQRIKDSVDLVIDSRFEKGSSGKASSIIALGPTGEVNIIRQ